MPCFLKNMGQSRPLFVYFRSFLIPITISIIQIEKSIDDVLGIRTQGRMMVGQDETTELWRHPRNALFRGLLTKASIHMCSYNNWHGAV